MGFKIVKDYYENKPSVIPMNEMQPCQIAMIPESYMYCPGHIVMRTADLKKFEVMDLSKIGKNSCWGEESNIDVELLQPGERIILEVTEDNIK